jgi:predicted dehydrogenase
MRIGLIGLGSIGERHARNIRTLYPKADIHILTKRRAFDGLKNIRLENNATKFFSEVHDVYFVTNETAKHTDTILQCLKQRPRGIFIEKPLTHTPRDVIKIRSALKKNPTVFFVGYCLPFSKPLQTMKKLIDTGTIGSVRAIRVSVGSDVRTWRKTDYRSRYSSDASRGGGVVLDLIHEINYPAWLLGERMRLVAGYVGKVALPINAEDIAESIFVSDGGTIISIHQDYFQTPGGRFCALYGSRGTITWDGKGYLTVRIKNKSRTVTVKEDGNTMYKKELAWFIKQVHLGKNVSNFEEAAQDVVNAEHLKTYEKRSKK